MILIHTALLCEAQSFIEYYKLKKINSKIYSNDKIVILISGVGKQKTIKELNNVFSQYSIKKAFNIGIAGCNDEEVTISSLFCTNKHLKNFNFLPLITKDEITTDSIETSSTLYDMEAKYFEEAISEKLTKDSIFVFKIVSDHLSKERLAKDFIKKIIANQKNLHKFIQEK